MDAAPPRYVVRWDVFSCTILFVVIASAVGETSADADVSLHRTPRGTVEACGRTVQVLRENMKPTVDPCEDFYEFACGNFGEHHPLPEDRSSFTTFDVVTKEVQAILLKSLSADGPPNEIKPLKNVRQLFNKLTDKAVLEKNDFSGLVALDKKLRGSETLEELVVNGKTNGIELLVKFIMIEDSTDPAKKKTVIFSYPKFTVGRSNLVAKDRNINASKIREAYVRLVSESLKLFDPNLKDTEAKAKNILDLEMQLAKITASVEDKRKGKVAFIKFSKNNLSEFTPGFNMARVVDGILGNRTVDSLFVPDSGYFPNLSRVLQGKDDVVKDLMTWKLIEEYGRVESAKFNELRSEFMKVAKGMKKKLDQREEILGILIIKARYALARLYIDTVGFDEEDRERVSSMVNNLKDAMKKLFADNDWMDDASRVKAEEKVLAMRANIGYPVWIKNDTELTSWFDSEFDESEGNFQALQKLYKFRMHHLVSKMDKLADTEHDWIFSPSMAIAGHSRLHNIMYFPAALLRGVLYTKGCPDALNYGAIGSIIGNDITRGFDFYGSWFDANGHRVNWWSNKTREKYKKASKNIIDQYSSIVDAKTNLTLNGLNTHREDIAENGGVRVSYRAFLANGSHGAKVTDLEDWTDEKLFFLSYANHLCGVANDEGIRHRILRGPQSPNRYRVNVPLSNLEDFARAFQCKTGSKMNPKEKVRVW